MNLGVLMHWFPSESSSQIEVSLFISLFLMPSYIWSDNFLHSQIIRVLQKPYLSMLETWYITFWTHVESSLYHSTLQVYCDILSITNHITGLKGWNPSPNCILWDLSVIKCFMKGICYAISLKTDIPHPNYWHIPAKFLFSWLFRCIPWMFLIWHIPS